MLILGLTGSIAMGKSTTAHMFRTAGIPVWDADASVHRLYAGAAVDPVGAAFPGVIRDGVIDRSVLRDHITGDETALKRLEAIVHPLVREDEMLFLNEAAAQKSRMVLLDIPLLFETGAANRVDAVVVVTADPAIQRARVLARPGMTEAVFGTILSRQMSDGEKRRRAHCLIDTGHGIEAAEWQVSRILKMFSGVTGHVWADRMARAQAGKTQA